MFDRWHDGRRARLTIAGLLLALLVPFVIACGPVAVDSTPQATMSAVPTATTQAIRTSTLAALPTSTAPPRTAVRTSTAATPGPDATASGDTGRFARGGLAGTALSALAVGGRDGQLLFAGGQGLWRSTDGGQRWEAVLSAMAAPRVAAIAIAPSDPQIVYVGVGAGCGRGRSVPGLVSTDGGAHWRESGLNIGDLAVDPTDANKVWAVSCAGVQRSTDGGGNWEPATGAQLDGHAPTLIALVPRMPRVVYVAYAAEGGAARVRRTIDDGATWQDTGLPMAAFGPLALTTDPVKPDSVFLSTLVGIFRSLDGGQSWMLLSAGLEGTRPAPPPAGAPDGFHLTTALVAAPNAPDTFWVGTGAGPTKGIGVFGTRDGGTSWQWLSGGIEGRTVQALAIGVTRNRSILYAATDDGVWLLNTP